MTQLKPRAFWLKKLEDSKLYIAYPTYKDEALHVIEFYAYEKWKTEAMKYWYELEKLKRGGE